MSSGRPCFIGAQGYGTLTPGGRGGRVIRVTNTFDDNPAPAGSLREAWRAHGPRNIVFDVEGRIHLIRPLKMVDPFCSVYGRTAPGDGIEISGDYVSVQTHDVVVQDLRCRIGDERLPTEGGDSGDAANTGDPDNLGGSYNIVFNHCDFEYSLDEVLTFWWQTHDCTVSNSIIGFPLNNSLHPKGAHPMCHLFGSRETPPLTYTSRISSHHNLLPWFGQRGPQVAQADEIDYRGNVHAGPWTEPLALEKADGPPPLAVKRVNFFRNWYGMSRAAGRHPTIVAVKNDASAVRLFAAENFGPLGNRFISDPKFDNWLFVRLFGGLQLPEEIGGVRFRLDAPFACPRVCVLPTEQNREYVLANAGARKQGPLGTEVRDRVSQAIVRMVREDADLPLIDTPSQGPGYVHA